MRKIDATGFTEKAWVTEQFSGPTFPTTEGKLKLVVKSGRYKIIAKQGDKRYLVDVGDGKGRVVDTFQQIAYEPANINSIIARGYWQDYTEQDEAVLRLL